MKQYHYKIVRDVFFVLVGLVFFVMGMIIAIQLDTPAGCIIILISLAFLGLGVCDIAINSNAINELREEQAKEKSSLMKEEKQLAILERYKKLHEDGLVSDEEFELRKKTIMRDLSRK